MSAVALLKPIRLALELSRLIALPWIWRISLLNAASRISSVFAPLAFVVAAKKSPDVLGVIEAVSALIFLYTFSTSISAVLSYRLTLLKGTLYTRLTERFCAHIYDCPVRYASLASSHSILKDIEKVQHTTFEMVHQFHDTILPNTIVYFASLFVAIHIYGWMAATFLVVGIALYFLLLAVFIPKLRNLATSALKSEYAVLTFTKDLLEGSTSIRAIGASAAFFRALERKLSILQSINRAIARLFVYRNLAIEALRFAFVLGVMIVAALESNENPTVVYAKIMALYFIASRLFDPIDGLVKTTVTFLGSEAPMEQAILLLGSLEAGKRIHNYSDISLAPSRHAADLLFLDAPGVDVQGKRIILPCQLEVREGDLIQFCGSNGTGKSTIARAIANLDEICAGALYARSDLTVAYSHAEAILINGTIWDNIRFFRAIERKAATEIIPHFGLFPDVSPDAVLDKITAEKGHNLSLGQRAKVILLRSAMTKPDVLIIDEVLSAIDEESFVRIVGYLKRVTKALIVIDHGGRIQQLATSSIELRGAV